MKTSKTYFKLALQAQVRNEREEQIKNHTGCFTAQDTIEAEKQEAKELLLAFLNE